MKKMFIRFKDERAFLDAEKEELGRWSDDLQRASLAQVQDLAGEIVLATSKSLLN